MQIAQIGWIVLNNLAAIATLILALVTTISVVEFSRGAMRQSIATAESRFMPVPRLDLNAGSFQVLTIDFSGNEPFNPEVEIVGDEPWEAEFDLTEDGMAYRIEFDYGDFQDFLREQSNQPPEDIRINLEYRSPTNKYYSHSFKVDFSTYQKDDGTILYEAESYSHSGATLPWENVRLKDSVPHLKHFTR